MVSVLCIAQGLGLGLYAVFNQSSVFLTKIDNPTRGHSGMSQGRPKADLCKQTEKVRPNSRYTNQQGSNATSDQNRDLTEGRYLQNNPAQRLDLAHCLPPAGSEHWLCCNRYTPKSVSIDGVGTVAPRRASGLALLKPYQLEECMTSSV